MWAWLILRPDVVKHKESLESLPKGKKKKKRNCAQRLVGQDKRSQKLVEERLLLVKVRTLCTSENNNNNNRSRYNEF